MTEEKKVKKAVDKTYTAKKKLTSFDGKAVAIGEDFTCTESQAKHFKKAKAI